MKVILIGEVPQSLVARVESLFGSAEITKTLGFFSPRINESVVICHSQRIREAFSVARKVKRVWALSYPTLGEAMELVGALRENGIEAGVLSYGNISVEEYGVEPSAAKNVEVGILKPREPKLLTWAIEDGNFYKVKYMDQIKAGDNYKVIGSESCDHFPTYDARIVVLRDIVPFDSHPVVVKDVEDNGLKVEVPCGWKADYVTLVRPNKRFTRFIVNDGTISGDLFVPVNKRPYQFLVSPLGMTFLAVKTSPTGLMGYLKTIGIIT